MSKRDKMSTDYGLYKRPKRRTTRFGTFFTVILCCCFSFLPHKQNGGNHSLLIGFEEAKKQKEQQRQQTKNYWQKYCIIIFIKTEEQQICWNGAEGGRKMKCVLTGNGNIMFLTVLLFFLCFYYN